MNLVRMRNHPSFLNFFDHIFEGNIDESNNCSKCVPLANIIENEKSFNVDIAIPGVDKKDVKINIENNLLTVSSEKKEEKNEEKKNFTRKEFVYNSFSRSFTLPKIIDTEKIQANYENGVLKLELPKKDEGKFNLKKEIEIS
jgi:HSP20 family protein